MAKSNLVAAAFPAQKQKGRKVETKTGEKKASATHQQHGELAYADQPEKVSNAKPKHVNDHATKKVKAPGFSLGAKSSNMVSPKAAVEADAHYAKVNATRDWVSGHIDSKKHDAIHRRANAVLKHRGKRP